MSNNLLEPQNSNLRVWVHTLLGFKSLKAGNKALTILQAVYNLLRPHTVPSGGMRADLEHFGQVSLDNLLLEDGAREGIPINSETTRDTINQAT